MGEPTREQMRTIIEAVREGNARKIESLLSHWNITRLDFSERRIGDTGASTIADVLVINHTLTYLNLSSNEIGIFGAKAIENALLRNSTLVHLDLRYNRIGGQTTEFYNRLQLQNPRLIVDREAGMRERYVIRCLRLVEGERSQPASGNYPRSSPIPIPMPRSMEMSI